MLEGSTFGPRDNNANTAAESVPATSGAAGTFAIEKTDVSAAVIAAKSSHCVVTRPLPAALASYSLNAAPDSDPGLVSIG
ncbi:hypothetical protein BKG76_21960 [Mycobacteroides franklinii]|uniref:Uncharacterized protein n=1 Tax=Mycobacteroides franklinii TaxID=948102 RepID=A0A1S1L5W1_9MYCO|nr:hypothetical protein BKG76_21960 [Mycobacteroides franklinii]